MIRRAWPAPAVVALTILAACGGDAAQPAGGAGDPATSASPTTPPPATDPAPATTSGGTAELAFGDVELTGQVSRCDYDPGAQAPEDGSPLTVLAVIATAEHPSGDPWEIQVVRTLSGSSVIDVVRAHPDTAPPVDRYEAQIVVDTGDGDVSDQWGDREHPLLVPEVDGEGLTITPPGDVTFGVYPAEGDARVVGDGTFTITCAT